jgi:hypothetical protein
MNGALLGVIIYFVLLFVSVFLMDSKYKAFRWLANLIQIVFAIFFVFLAVKLFWIWWSADISPIERLFWAVPVLFIVYLFGADALKFLKDKLNKLFN